MCITRLQRRQATIALVGLAFIAAGCAHDDIVGPGAPQSAPGTASFSAATIANGTRPSGDERAASEDIARKVAIALSDPALRQEIKLAFATSGIKEGKLDFTSYASGRGTALISAIAAKTGATEESFARQLSKVRPLEFYMPVKTQRDSWTGDASVLVGVALRQAETPVAFDITGTRIVLDHDRPPARPVIMLVQVETVFGKQIAENLAGRALVSCAALQQLTTASVSTAMSQCARGGAQSWQNQPSASFQASPNNQGLYASFFRLMDAKEAWFMGDPELEIHATAKNTRFDVASVQAQCIGEHAVDAPYQPGVRSSQYVYDQNGDFWEGLVLLLSPRQMDLAMQSEPDGFNLSIWEDDDEPCKIKVRGPRDFFIQSIRRLFELGVTAVALVQSGGFMGWGLFGAAVYDFIDLVVGDDDYVGLLVQKDQTEWAGQHPDNNYVVLIGDKHFNGRATLELLDGTPSTNAVTSVLVSPNQPDNLPPGSTVAMEARGYDANGRIANVSSISWSSSNPGVASVSSGGVVTTLAEGTSTITATVNGISASTTSTVYGPVSYVQITPQFTQIYPGNTVFLQAQPYDSHGTPVPGRPVSWFSQDPNVAGVDQGGLVTGYIDGSALIQANVDGASGYARVDVGSAPPCGGGEPCNMMVPGSGVGPTAARPPARGRANTPPPKRSQTKR